MLNEMGGLAELEERDGVVSRGYSCPLAAATPDHPEMCRMAEILSAELTAFLSASAATAARVLAAVSRSCAPTRPNRSSVDRWQQTHRT